MRKSASAKRTDWRERYRQSGLWAFYGLCFGISFSIFYLRFPNNFTSPNFYAEDGYVFARALLEKGFFEALLTPFNGYFIWGIYLLEQTGIWLNQLLLGGSLITLPQIFALVSYGFLAFSCTLPILLFAKKISRTGLLLLTLVTSFVPMAGWDYAVIGTIGNLKFVFLYIAFLLILYRIWLPEGSRRVWAIDLLLLICAYTNATVYLLIPWAAAPYLKGLGKDKWHHLMRLPRRRSVKSLAGLVLLLLPQVIMIKLAGIPELPGYLDSPFNPQRWIEILLNRPLLYPFTYLLNKAMNDGLVILLLTALIIFMVRLSYRKNLLVTGFALYTAFCSTALFVLSRSGISDHFFGYQSGGPDQFFYAQNLVMYFALFWVLYQGLGKIDRVLVGGFILFVLPFTLPHASTYGKNNFMEERVGTITANARLLCADTAGETVALPIYPAKELVYVMPKQQLCPLEPGDSGAHKW